MKLASIVVGVRMNALRWLCISSLIICATLPSGYSNNDIASNSSYISEAICDDHASVDLYELVLEGYLLQEELPALERRRRRLR